MACERDIGAIIMRKNVIEKSLEASIHVRVTFSDIRTPELVILGKFILDGVSRELGVDIRLATSTIASMYSVDFPH